MRRRSAGFWACRLECYHKEDLNSAAAKEMEIPSEIVDPFDSTGVLKVPYHTPHARTHAHTLHARTQCTRARLVTRWGLLQVLYIRKLGGARAGLQIAVGPAVPLEPRVSRSPPPARPPARPRRA